MLSTGLVNSESSPRQNKIHQITNKIVIHHSYVTSPYSEEIRMGGGGGGGGRGGNEVELSE